MTKHNLSITFLAVFLFLVNVSLSIEEYNSYERQRDTDSDIESLALNDKGNYKLGWDQAKLDKINNASAEEIKNKLFNYETENQKLKNIIKIFNDNHNEAISKGNALDLNTPKIELSLDDDLFICLESSSSKECFPLVFLDVEFFNQYSNSKKIEYNVVMRFKTRFNVTDFNDLIPCGFNDVILGYNTKGVYKDATSFYVYSPKLHNIFSTIRSLKNSVLKKSFDYFFERIYLKVDSQFKEKEGLRLIFKEYLESFNSMHQNLVINDFIIKFVNQNLTINQRIEILSRINTSHPIFKELTTELEYNILTYMKDWNWNYKWNNYVSRLEDHYLNYMVIYLDSKKTNWELEKDRVNVFWDKFSIQFRKEFVKILQSKINEYIKNRKKYLKILKVGDKWSNGYIEQFNKDRNKVQIRINRSGLSDQLSWVDFK